MREDARHHAGRWRRRNETGQSLTETIIALTIVLTIVFGLIHLSFLAVTRHVCNFAAFAGARATVYGGAGDDSRGQAAARSIVQMLGRGTTFLQSSADSSGYRVDVLSPFSYPLFNNGAGSKIRVSSLAPRYTQPSISEAGDNARR
jgi:hypothetical protein